MWSNRATPVVVAIRWPSPSPKDSLTQARVNAWCMMWLRQPVSVITSLYPTVSPSRNTRSRGISTSSKITTASISSNRDDSG